MRHYASFTTFAQATSTAATPLGHHFAVYSSGRTPRHLAAPSHKACKVDRILVVDSTQVKRKSDMLHCLATCTAGASHSFHNRAAGLKSIESLRVVYLPAGYAIHSFRHCHKNSLRIYLHSVDPTSCCASSFLPSRSADPEVALSRSRLAPAVLHQHLTHIIPQIRTLFCKPSGPLAVG